MMKPDSWVGPRSKTLFRLCCDFLEGDQNRNTYKQTTRHSLDRKLRGHRQCRSVRNTLKIKKGSRGQDPTVNNLVGLLCSKTSSIEAENKVEDRAQSESLLIMYLCRNWFFSIGAA